MVRASLKVSKKQSFRSSNPLNIFCSNAADHLKNLKNTYLPISYKKKFLFGKHVKKLVNLRI